MYEGKVHHELHKILTWYLEPIESIYAFIIIIETDMPLGGAELVLRFPGSGGEGHGLFGEEKLKRSTQWEPVPVGCSVLLGMYGEKRKKPCLSAAQAARSAERRFAHSARGGLPIFPALCQWGGGGID